MHLIFFKYYEGVLFGSLTEYLTKIMSAGKLKEVYDTDD